MNQTNKAVAEIMEILLDLPSPREGAAAIATVRANLFIQGDATTGADVSRMMVEDDKTAFEIWETATARQTMSEEHSTAEHDRPHIENYAIYEEQIQLDAILRAFGIAESDCDPVEYTKAVLNELELLRAKKAELVAALKIAGAPRQGHGNGGRGMITEDRFRSLAHSMPPSDFGSTRAIQAAAKLADELAATELERLRAEKSELIAAIDRYLADDFSCNGGAE